ncbi:hypothetical protein SISSUDRAFT_1054120 [Sistotremastrum suecicum HHB10207 ss-3]|uniref:Membrane insertase YidC/Oxa/ALB C-terminal domain-containing protein n=1 Tax=Sistotremastrum suecicum HHB10207 ss-3 TaxID=1314776 RepID=A0A165YRR1_9AGAM|nr:hypothetical protein SISSUDRAFT_1054120 [Sistotremastrum suecicum HHB10207 ss-3]
MALRAHIPSSLRAFGLAGSSKSFQKLPLRPSWNVARMLSGPGRCQNSNVLKEILESRRCHSDVLSNPSLARQYSLWPWRSSPTLPAPATPPESVTDLETIPKPPNSPTSSNISPDAPFDSFVEPPPASPVSAETIPDALSLSEPLTSLTPEPLVSTAALAISTIPPSALGRIWLPIGFIQYIFIGISTVLPSLPAWSIIVLGTFTLRMMVSPWYISQLRLTARTAQVQPQILHWQAKIQDAARRGDQPSQQIAALQLRKVMKDNGVGPGKVLGNAMIMFIPTICSFFAVRRFCEVDPPIPGIITGGPGVGIPGLVENLAVADPTYVLPVLAFAVFQAQLTVIRWEQAPPIKDSWPHHMPNIMRFVMLLTAPLFAHLPAGVFVYFIASSLWAIIQGVVLRFEPLRSRLNIPDRPILNDTPSFRETFVKIKEYFKSRTDEARSGW